MRAHSAARAGSARAAERIVEQAYGRADGPSASRSTATRLVLLRAREALDAPDWSIDIKVKVGAALLQQLLETARVPPLSAMRGADPTPAGWDARDDTPLRLYPVYMLRGKPPDAVTGGRTTVDWHQDAEYVVPIRARPVSVRRSRAVDRRDLGITRKRARRALSGDAQIPPVDPAAARDGRPI